MPEIEKLAATHDLSDFTSTRPPLDEWLRKHALQAQLSNSAVTYVAREDRAVIGFVSLASASIMPADMSARMKRGVSTNLPAPAQLLARLATARAHERRGIGSLLMLHAMRIVLSISKLTGVRVLMVNPLDADAADFYRKFDFEEMSGVQPVAMYLLMKDIAAIIRHYDAQVMRGLK